MPVPSKISTREHGSHDEEKKYVAAGSAQCEKARDQLLKQPGSLINKLDKGFPAAVVLRQSPGFRKRHS
jgi:hypothetical protein